MATEQHIPALKNQQGMFLLRDGAVCCGVRDKARIEAAGVGADEQLVQVVAVQAARHRLIPVRQLRKVRLRSYITRQFHCQDKQ